MYPVVIRLTEKMCIKQQQLGWPEAAFISIGIR